MKLERIDPSGHQAQFLGRNAAVPGARGRARHAATGAQAPVEENEPLRPVWKHGARITASRPLSGAGTLGAVAPRALFPDDPHLKAARRPGEPAGISDCAN